MVMQNHLIVGFLLVVVFTFRVGALLLIPLAVFIDGYFGAFYSVPMITMVAILWYVASEFVRPQLLMQYKRYEEAT
ncbi:MAG: hypothetical protein KBC62_01100 [Candidatus Pacebacteria bacterium]|nr:hypothetical protein [Candidatus Paceibacterota bacterium]MBP9842580.1 hypothetical protein [Candidatus Paceibacterota bacterium]